MENKVTLTNHSGGDKTHCIAAWQSTGLEFGLFEDYLNIDEIFELTTLTKKKSPLGLLTLLVSEGHRSPFEHSLISFQITSDIATHIHFLKHRVGVSINSESARYRELKEDKYYVPEDWSESWSEKLSNYVKEGQKLYHEAIAELEPVLGRKRAKESARFFLPYANQITYGVTFNFSSFIHFLSLRHSPHAQKEVNKIAAKMLELVKNLPDKPFKLSLKAYGYETEN